jgi:hypothetical protein
MPVPAGLESAPRFAEAIRRIFFGDQPPELMPPGFLLQVDPIEWHWAYRQRDWTTGAIGVVANAGNVGHIEVFNPGTAGGGLDQPGQPLIVVVTLAKVQNPFAGSIYSLTLNGAAGGTPTQNQVLDARFVFPVGGGGAISQNRILNTTVGISGISLDQHVGLAGQDFVFDVPDPSRERGVVLKAGDRIQIFNGTQNQQLFGVFSGYEFIGKAEELPDK